MANKLILGLAGIIAFGFLTSRSYASTTVYIDSTHQNGSFESPGQTVGTLPSGQTSSSWFGSGGSGTPSVSNAAIPGATNGTQFGDVTVGFGDEELNDFATNFTSIPLGSTNILFSFDAIQIHGANPGDNVSWFWKIPARFTDGSFTTPFDLVGQTSFSPTSSWSHFSFYIPFNVTTGATTWNFLQATIGGAATNHVGVSELGIDNVSLILIPEPATLAVLGVGCVGLLAKRRSKLQRI